ncbi:MAG TPA: PPK2 family polyphosphate kinase [Acidimicrobiales bacterium]
MGERASVAQWLVAPGSGFRLADVDASATPGAPGGKEATVAASGEVHATLGALQERLWAEDARSLLVVFQAMDAGGKDGTIKKVFTGVNPQGVEVTSFKAPTDEELAHDFLWRVHAKTPARGRIGIFNRSHYEDVLVARVHGLISDDERRARYDRINEFERLLTGAGTTVVKVMLHISRDEQAERLRRRLERPDKRWKFRKGDLAERERWDEYMVAFEDAIAATSTELAPWFVVPADKKWYRDWVVLQILVDALQKIDPQFPEPEEDLDGVVVR